MFGLNFECDVAVVGVYLMVYDEAILSEVLYKQIEVVQVSVKIIKTWKLEPHVTVFFLSVCFKTET